MLDPLEYSVELIVAALYHIHACCFGTFNLALSNLMQEVKFVPAGTALTHLFLSDTVHGKEKLKI